MLQYKIIRTKYSSIDYAKPESIEKRLNEAAREGWRVEKAMSSHLGDARSIVETYVLSKEELTDEERAKMEETFRKLGHINSPGEAQSEDVKWIVLPDDANVERWADVYSQLAENVFRTAPNQDIEKKQAMAETLDWVYGNQDTLHTIP